MATYTFQSVLVSDMLPGGGLRTLRNGRVTVKSAADDSTVTVATSDQNGLINVTTTDVPSIYYVTDNGFTSDYITAASILVSAGAAALNNDAGVASFVSDTGSATYGALSSTFAAKSRTGAKAVGQGELMVNVADYATPADAMAAVAAGGRVFFPPATYALGATPLTATVDDVHIDALGATFTLNTWGYPAFDLLDVDGWTLDIGLVQYVGTRGDHTGTSLGRGQAAYAQGSGVYTNGDRHHIRNLRTIDMPTPVNLSSWDGSNILGRVGQSNRIGRLECEGYDFGVLWIGQKDLTVESIYAHDDHDDSGGTNPTHAFYCTATTTFRSSNVKIGKAHTLNNVGGHAYQLKYCDNTQIGEMSADSCAGILNVIDCHDLSWNSLVSTNTVAGAAGSVPSLTLQTTNTNCQRPQMNSTTIVMAANQNRNPVSIYADDAMIDALTVVSNYPSGVGTGLGAYNVRLGGLRGVARSVKMTSVGAEHVQGIQVGSSGVPTSGWSILDPIANGPRSVVIFDGTVGTTDPTAIRYDPGRQTITGGGSAISATSGQWYPIGSVPTMGKVAASGSLTLTGTAADIPGATVTLNPAVAGKLLVTGFFDCTSAAVEPLAGSLVVDGSAQTATSLFTASAGTRATVGQSWVVSLAAGSHTVKLQGVRAGGSNAGHVMNGTHTGFSYQFTPGAA